MFSHVMLGADDVPAAKKFYDAALGALGISAGAFDEWGRVVYSSKALAATRYLREIARLVSLERD